MQHPIGMKKDDDNSFFKVPYQTKFAEREAQCILGECRPLCRPLKSSGKPLCQPTSECLHV